MTWNYAYTTHIWPSAFAVVMMIALSVYAWRRRRVPGALPFSIGCLLTLPLAVSIIMGYAAVDVATKIFWFKVESVWQLPATTAITCFILEYAWPGRWLTRRNLTLFSIAPLLLLLFVLTNDLHHLAWRGFAFDGSVIPQYSPVSWVFIVYGFAWTFVNIVVFAWLFLRSPQHRWPVVIMLFAQIGVRVLFLMGSAKLEAWLFYVPDFAIPYLAYAIALFGFRILDPIALARRTVITQMQDGMLVLDPEDRVTSLNPAAQAILGTTAKLSIGRPIQAFLPAYAEGQAGQTEVRCGVGAKTRYYALATSALKDWRGLVVGRLMLLHDMTGQKQAQAQLVEQQRALAMLHEREQLARELHDSLGQVFAFVNTQGQTVHRLLSRGDISTADAYVKRLVEVARLADVDIRESILGLRVTLSEQGFFTALIQYLAQYEKNYGIHTELDKPEPFTDGAFEPLVEVQLLRILQEALSNVRKHANASCVRIAFASENGCARVTVQDDGQGFDPGMMPDVSGEHVGLRVMRERAGEVGGSLSLHFEPGQGTLVLVQVPVGMTRKSGDTEQERDGDGMTGRHGDG